MKKIIIYLFLLAISVVWLTGCNSSDNNESETNDKHTIIEVQAGNDVVINKDEITGDATYYNYSVDDVIIQLFVFKASDDTIRVVFNTCYSCNPSPMSYFIQIGDYFECQNCKNKFHKDEVGIKQGYGCSPVTILSENKEETESTITVSSKFIETYKEKFASMNVYKN